MNTVRKLTFSVHVPIVLAVSVAAFEIVNTSRLVRARAWVEHTHEVRLRIDQLGSSIDAAEADVRGFLLTGDSVYVARTRSHAREADANFTVLTTLTRDNPAQEQRLAAIRVLLSQRQAALDQTIALRSEYASGRSSPDQLTIGEDLTTRLDSITSAADDVEASLLAARSVAESETERALMLAAAVLAVLTVVLAVGLNRSIRRDLIARLRAEADLRASEAKFAGILDIAADAVVSIDERQSIVHFNRSAEAIFGYCAAEAIGKPLDMLLPARHVHAHRDHVAGFAASAATSRHMAERRDLHGRRKNGSEFSAEASVSKLTTPAGMILTAMVRDVSERKALERHERALAAAGVTLARSLDYDETLRAATELPVPWVGAWSVLDLAEEEDADGPPFQRLASRHDDPTVNAALREWQAEQLDWDSPDAVIDVLRTGKAILIESVHDEWLEAHVIDARLVGVARRMGMHSLMIVPLMTKGRPVGTLTVGSMPGHVFDDRDLALAAALADRASLAIENTRLFRRAQRATAARNQVLSIVSHDLRNPLSAVMMLAQRVRERPLTDEERQTIGVTLASSASWMHRLMQDLVDTASIDAGKLSIEPDAQIARVLIDEAVAMFAERASAKRIALTVETPPKLPWVLADGARVVQVLGNLIGNAFKFTNEGGSITVGASDKAEEVLFWVRDTGSGISEQDLPRVFDRFWHARKNSKASGSGLGLAIAQGIVQAHGGRIWVESVERQGSTFYFTIPIAKRSAPDAVLAGADLTKVRGFPHREGVNLVP